MEINCTIPQAQNSTAINPVVFWSGIRQLLVTNKGRSACPSARYCQGQLKTPQSMSVPSVVSSLLLSSVLLNSCRILSWWQRKTLTGSDVRITEIREEKPNEILELHPKWPKERYTGHRRLPSNMLPVTDEVRLCFIWAWMECDVQGGSNMTGTDCV